jgi:nucleoside-diphosphate-sugar epimerase
MRVTDSNHALVHISMSDKHVVITGAGGFVGQRLAKQLLSEPAYVDARFTLTDIAISKAPKAANVRVLEGDLCERAFTADVLGTRADIVYHLAGVLGGAAEANYPLSRKVNVDASLSLLEALRDERDPPRVIFASSIAVFGPPLPAVIDDDTMPVAVMHYGGQKRMVEVAIEQLSAHGWIDGIALRLPGIVARRGADSRLKSAFFLNTMFYDYADGKDFTIPVSPEGTVWLLSVAACVQAFVHAAQLQPAQLGRRRALTLPAHRVSMSQLIAALRERYPESSSKVHWDPDPQLQALFARQPPLSTSLGDKLGFQRDVTISRLIDQAMLSG